MTHEEFIEICFNTKTPFDEKYDKFDIIDDMLYIYSCINFSETIINPISFEPFPITLALRNYGYDCLPDNLITHNSLDIRYSNIKKLPENLYINDNLILDNNIYELPENFYIGGQIYTNYKLKANERVQLMLIKHSCDNLKIFKNPTKKAKALHNLLWVI